MRPASGPRLKNLKRKTADLTNPTLEALHCPICSELPRQAPIFHCSRGHLLCANCQPRVASCPLCRCPNIGNRSQFAERLLATALDGLVLDCKNRGEGCTVKDLAYKVAEHEKICVYREVKCPARHRGACSWVGPLAKMLLHVIDGKCAQIVKSRIDNAPFVSVIGNFNAKDMTVFGRMAMTHWKPVLLISRQIIRLFAYLVIYRDEKGNWIVYLRSYASDEALSKLQATITVRLPQPANKKDDDKAKTVEEEIDYSSSSANNVKIKTEADAGNDVVNAKIKTEADADNDVVNAKIKTEDNSGKPAGAGAPLQISMTCRLANQKMTEQEVIDSGHYLCLKDSQVRKLCLDRTLFEYAVTIEETEDARM